MPSINTSRQMKSMRKNRFFMEAPESDSTSRRSQNLKHGGNGGHKSEGTEEFFKNDKKGRPKKTRTPWSDSSSRYEGGFFSSRLRCSSSSFFFSSGVFGRGGALRASGSPRGGGGSALRLSGGGGGG